MGYYPDEDLWDEVHRGLLLQVLREPLALLAFQSRERPEQPELLQPLVQLLAQQLLALALALALVLE
jgi:hypothetical protein